MQTKYKDLAAAGKISIGQCLEVIRNGIDGTPNKMLEVGNSLLFNKGRVTYFRGQGLENVELYSENAWGSLDAIANWADIVEDCIACKAAGNKLYSVTWNIKKD